ncbi:MAG: sulfatase-like hydrolase/transferase [Lachnospiraceae bacterium]|nr:sulfatase-like hydrolase/transferase [Lachnospiraceae bacterium]
MKKKQICQALVFLVLGFLEFITVELFFDRYFTDLDSALILKNVLLYWVGNLILVSLFHWMKPAMLISTVFILVLGVANYLVTMFRGYGIVFMDLYAVRTAATVAGHYSMEWKPCFAAGMAVGILSIFLCFFLPEKQGRYFKKKTMLASLLGLAFSALFFFWIQTSGAFFRGISDLAWDHRIGIHDYGYVLYFTANAGIVKEDEPHGYSSERAEEILSRYRIDPGKTISPERGSSENTRDVQSVGSASATSDPIHPNLIMIMNESFADLRVLGEDFSTNQNVMPFYDSLTENTIKGYAEASVYGGYTSNSEFEFLTGCTKVFLPGNPYLQYVTQELPTLISTVKAQKEYGEAVALHPYRSSGYNRNRVYPLFSFDRFLSLEDFTDPELLRDYVSDAEDYRRICKLYEEKPTGSRLCLFNVTMQNHNPYRSQWISDDPVQMAGSFQDDSVNQYLSLMKQSDNALQELIRYFQSVPEPTLIVFFGDHQPHLPDGFYGHVMDKFPVQFELEDVMKEHLVPYLLWANYDIPEQIREEVSSLNYLSPLVLQTAGLPLTDYHRFLLDLQKAVPSLSASGYLDAQGNMEKVDQADEETAKWLEEYEIVQYYYLFDRKHRLDQYFTIS